MAAYPRKQTVVIFAICLIAVSGVSYYIYGQSKAANIAHPAQNEASTVDINAQALSTNSDWQKQFLNIASTTNDFKATTKSALGKEPDLTDIDQLGRNFLNQYASLYEAGLTGNQEMVNSVMEQVAAQSASVAPVQKIYTLSDITNVPTNNDSIRAYAAAIDSVFKDYSSRPDEATIAAQALESGDTSLLSRIDPIIIGHQSTVDDLLSLPVPNELVSYHLDLLNGFSAVLASTKAFRNVDTDALRGFAAVKGDAIGTGNILLAFSNIQKYLTDAKVASRY